VRLAGFQPSATYRAKFQFPAHVEAAARTVFASALRDRLAGAMLTARR
jgi:hypothetical protein